MRIGETIIDPLDNHTFEELEAVREKADPEVVSKYDDDPDMVYLDFKKKGEYPIRGERCGDKWVYEYVPFVGY